MIEDVGESFLNLGVGGESAFVEGLDDAVEFELANEGSN
jgi:hypothetical protein